MFRPMLLSLSLALCVCVFLSPRLHERPDDPIPALRMRDLEERADLLTATRRHAQQYNKQTTRILTYHYVTFSVRR